jgi:hypothetical protein
LITYFYFGVITMGDFETAKSVEHKPVRITHGQEIGVRLQFMAAAQISAVPAEKIRLVPADRINGLDAEQIGGMTQDQRDALLPEQVRALWAAALRSGLYKQTFERLIEHELSSDGKLGEAMHCNLGVLCDLLYPNDWQRTESGTLH